LAIVGFALTDVPDDLELLDKVAGEWDR